MTRRISRNDTINQTDSESHSVTKIVKDWLLGLRRMKTEELVDRETLVDSLEANFRTTEDLNPSERLMLLNVLHLGDVRVGTVMIPRADIVAVDVETDLTGLIAAFCDGYHTRIPVFRGTLDDLLGFVHIKNTLQFWETKGDFKLHEKLGKLLFVPQSMRVVDLLLQMRLQRVHMAAVVDEYGGTDGLVTINDLVEEIVGEIEDEYERAPGPMFSRQSDGSLLVDARAPLEGLAARVGIKLIPNEREEDIESVGGLIFSLVGRVPLRGEVILHSSGIEFEVIDSDPRRVKRILVKSPVHDSSDIVQGD